MRTWRWVAVVACALTAGACYASGAAHRGANQYEMMPAGGGGGGGSYQVTPSQSPMASPSIPPL